MDLQIAQLAVTTAAVIALLSPLLLLAYQAGRGSRSTGKSVRFDKVTPDVFLNGSHWRAEFDPDDGQSSPEVITLELRQTGGRIFGEGLSPEGMRHSFEGVLAGRRVCYVALDEERRHEWLGMVQAEILSGEQQMVGLRTRWSLPSQTMLVRKVTFSRLG